MPCTALGHEVPLVPWSKVATDIFHYESHSYLLIVEYPSRFPIVREIKSVSAQHIAEHLRLIFSEYRWSDTIVSDNGPCYAAETFTNLMKEYAVNHITSSLHYPQSNGLAEEFVQIVKNLFHKVKDEGTYIHKSLMIYCNTLLASTSKSPMQMLQQRSTRLQLLMSNAARRQLGIAVEQLSSNKNQHLPAHDFHIGQEVMCQSPITKRWFPAPIKALCPEPRSYQIETQEGITYRRIISEQYQKCSNTNRTPVNDDCMRIQAHPKRQIKTPVKLNL